MYQMLIEPSTLSRFCQRLRKDPHLPADAAIIIPVNAREDMSSTFRVLQDLSSYQGQYALELVLVINNYSPQEPPDEIGEFERAGIKVVSVPDLFTPGRTIIINARLAGLKQVSADCAIMFDADCRIPDPTRLIDWYIQQFRSGVDLAYTHVDYYELPSDSSVKVRMFIHHLTRWVKREWLGIPTCRGSNYAIRNRMMRELYDEGLIKGDITVGRAVKAAGGKIAYNGERALTVLTSGRKFETGWIRMFQYFLWRLGINLRAGPARSGPRRTAG